MVWCESVFESILCVRFEETVSGKSIQHASNILEQNPPNIPDRPCSLLAEMESRLGAIGSSKTPSPEVGEWSEETSPIGATSF